MYQAGASVVDRTNYSLCFRNSVETTEFQIIPVGINSAPISRRAEGAQKTHPTCTRMRSMPWKGSVLSVKLQAKAGLWEVNSPVRLSQVG